MPASNSAWGIEVGAYAVKALRLERSGDNVSLTDYAYIPHKKVLSTPDLDREEMTRLSLGQFISQQRGTDSAPTVMSVPGNAAFARFAKLPPVEPKKVPDIVKFEAVQQIPFPIEEVEWDYQTFMTEGAPDVEVGIFAMTKSAVQGRLNLYNELGLMPDGLTLSPIAAYNGLSYDLALDESSPGVIILDIGTESTDLIVAEQGRCWVRTFPVGGHNFTDALISSFKLTYSKAEKLKSEAQTSKYRRQILSAMRPVFADLAQDVQRSIGYYQSMHSDADLKKLIGIGSTFKLPGLRKFLSQQLQMEVVRADEFNRIKFDGAVDSKFAEHSVNFATAYGLALQGLDMADIGVNLVPVPVIRERMWHSKIKWFGAAAAVAVAGALVTFVRPMADRNYIRQPDQYRAIGDTMRSAQNLKAEFDQVTQQTEIDAKALNIRKVLDYRDIWPQIYADVAAMVASANPQPELYSGDPDAIKSIPPGDRRLLDVKSVNYSFIAPGEGSSDDEENAQGTPMPRLRITMNVATTNKEGISFVNRHVIAWLTENATRADAPYRVVTSDKGPEILRADSTTIPKTGEESRSSGGAPAIRPERGPSMGKGREFIGEGIPGGEFGIGEGAPGGLSTGGGERGGYSRFAGGVNELAPLPEPADTLPPGTTVWNVSIGWTIELIPANQRFGGSDDEEVNQ